MLYWFFTSKSYYFTVKNECFVMNTDVQKWQDWSNTKGGWIDVIREKELRADFSINRKERLISIVTIENTSSLGW